MRSIVKGETDNSNTFVNWILATARRPSFKRGGLNDVVVTGSVRPVSSGSADMRYHAQFSFPFTRAPAGVPEVYLWAYDFSHGHDEGSFNESAYVRGQIEGLQELLRPFNSFYTVRLEGAGAASTLHVQRRTR